MTQQRYLCIHGHFYQPPRENPWLETVEPQDSAAPYHDWNERIAAECYEPNTAARILDGNGHIVRLVNNYARMSFNFGPTLLKLAGRQRARRLPGHSRRRCPERRSLQGPRLRHRPGVQPPILPWPARGTTAPRSAGVFATSSTASAVKPKACGCRRRRSTPKPLKISLPRASLSPSSPPTRPCVLAKPETGTGAIVRPSPRHHTALPRQPSERRSPSPSSSTTVQPPGRSPSKGCSCAAKTSPEALLGAFGEGDGPRLEHIATDGETYGHHHRHGEMALAYAVDYSSAKSLQS